MEKLPEIMVNRQPPDILRSSNYHSMPKLEIIAVFCRSGSALLVLDSPHGTLLSLAEAYGLSQ